MPDIIQETHKYINEIIAKKYCLPGEKKWEDVVARFEKKLAIDADKGKISKIAYNKIVELMNERKFIPGGSILYSFNNPKNTSLSNCYYLDLEKDSIEGIFNAIEKDAMIFSKRGGVGNSIEILRPKNEPTNNAAMKSSGSVSFIRNFSSTAKTIGQNGRRGALLISTSVWHPDIEDFISCKSDPVSVYGEKVDNSAVNISVKLSDEFLEAVENNADWQLVFPDITENRELYDRSWNGDINQWKRDGGKLKVYKKVKARALMAKIVQSSWSSGDPGVLFWDTINKYTPTAYNKNIMPRGMNPCGEQVLSNNGNCLLGASVLFKYVKEPYTINATFDYDSYFKDLESIFEFMDYLIDENNHPFEEQKAVDLYSRKIGYELTGIADTLAMLQCPYDSKKAMNFLEEFFKNKLDKETEIERKLAELKGPCPAYADTKKNIPGFDFSKPVRNISWSTFGPCGSISIIADNCSSGIEPIFAFNYTRKSIGEDYNLIHYPLYSWLVKNNPKDLDLPVHELKEKYYYKEAYDVSPENRIKIQSIIQRYTTDSISSTVNLPSSTTRETINNLIMLAWKSKLKGFTIFRENSSIEGVYNAKKSEDKDKEIFQIPVEAEAKRHVITIQGIKVYVVLCFDSKGKPFELFVNVPKELSSINGNLDKDAYLDKLSDWGAICRITSKLLQSGEDINSVIKQFQKSSYSYNNLSYHLAEILKKFSDVRYEKCPSCNTMSLTNSNGCKTCINCGFSLCDK